MAALADPGASSPLTAAVAAVAVGPTCSVEAEDEILAFLDDLEEEEVDPGVTRFFFFLGSSYAHVGRKESN